MFNLELFLIVFTPFSIFLIRKHYLNRIALLEEKNQKLLSDNDVLSNENIKLSADLKRIAVDYSNIRSAYYQVTNIKIEDMISELNRLNPDYKPEESKVIKYDIDEILNEINLYGFDKLSKDKKDFLKNNNLK